MFNTILSDINSRELYGDRKYNACCAKRIPASCIEYFECRSTQAFHLHSIVDTVSPPFACDYSPTVPDHLLVAQEDGLVHLFNTDLEGPGALIQDFEAHANAIFDVKWTICGTGFLTASGDQSIRLTHAERGVVVQQFFGHTMSVRCLAFMPGDSQIFASASRDGSVRLWDLRIKSDTVNFRGTPGASSVGYIPQCHLPNWPSTSEQESPPARRSRVSRRSGSDAQSVTSVVFMNDNTLLSAGSTDGSIKLWDLRRVFSGGGINKKPKPKSILRYRGISQKRSGYSDLRLNSFRTRLYANCLDNVVYEYDLTTQSTCPIFVYTGHQTDSFYIKLDVSPDDNYIVCGSSDRRAHIYTVGQRRQQPIVLSGHNGEVSVPRWSRHDPTRLVTLSDDHRAFVWKMFPSRRFTLPESGELAGLSERLSPAKVMMSPSEQLKRVLRSPRSSSKYPQLSVPAFSPASSPSVARRRQSNIRCFLEAISPPNPLSNVNKPSTDRSRPRNVATLPETLGGVVQRFPGLSSISTTNPATPPCGCYSTTTVGDTPLASLSTRNIENTKQFSLDIENICPETPRPISPINFTDAQLTKSPIIRIANRSSLIPTTPSTPGRKRTPLSQQQGLFDSPVQHNDPVAPSRKRTSSTDIPYACEHIPRPDVMNKRRRMTIFTTGDTQNQKPSASTNTTISRKRRMTTVATRSARPITAYFKSDQI